MPQWLEDLAPPKPGLMLNLLMGMVAGGVGAVVGNPAEVALVRMTADGRLPPQERRNYANAFSAVYRIVREEGVLTLWRGTGPTVMRAMALNAAQLGGYASAKDVLKRTGRFGDDVYLHVTASLIAGFLATAISIPIDITKTRLQTMKPNAQGQYPYTGVFDVLRKVPHPPPPSLSPLTPSRLFAPRACPPCGRGSLPTSCAWARTRSSPLSFSSR